MSSKPKSSTPADDPVTGLEIEGGTDVTGLATPDLIAQARSLEPLDKARTQGEWCNEEGTISSIDSPSVIATVLEADDFPCLDQDEEGQYEAACAECEANAAFIAAAPRAFALLRQLCDRLEALQKESTHENAWLCERGDNGPTRYVCIDPLGFFDWTEDVNKALRLCRREDADAVATIVDDCWRVSEHRWG